MFQTIAALILDPLLRLRLFFKNVSTYCKYPSLFVCDCLLYVFRLFYLTPKLLIKEDEELTYGESVYGSLYGLFTPYIRSEHRTFCDIGSGFGKVVFFADRVLKLQSSGVECNAIMVNVSRVLATVFRFKRSQFLLQDFKTGLPVCDLYLSPNTCLRGTSLDRLAQQLSLTKKGTLIFSISTPLPLVNAETLGTHSVLFSWGMATVYVQRVCDTL